MSPLPAKAVNCASWNASTICFGEHKSQKRGAGGQGGRVVPCKETLYLPKGTSRGDKQALTSTPRGLSMHAASAPPSKGTPENRRG